MAGGRTTVVVPYFQRERGLLGRCVRSILAQRPAPPASIIIVDDGSPVPAADELASLQTADRGRIDLVRTGNGGPARARNVGLDHVPADTEFVAFLDSDDEWDTDHLATAVHALGLGYDLYFSNFRLLGDELTLFDRFAPVRPADHRLLDAERGLYAFEGRIVDALIRNSFVRCSMTVFRHAVGAAVRFNEDLRHSDEDTLYWIEVCAGCNRIVFCTQPHTRIGRGVNINAVAPFGDAKTSRILIDEIKFYQHVLRHIADTDDQRRILREKIAETRQSFIRNALALVLRGNLRENAALARRYSAVDTELLAHIMPFVAGAVARRLGSRRRREAAERR